MRKHILRICVLIATLLAGCSSPTPTATPTAAMPITNPSDLINPPQPASSCIEISVSNLTPKVGEIITAVAVLKGVTKPNFWGLEVKDVGADASSMLINLMREPPYKAADISQIIKMVSAIHDDTTATIELRIASQGETNINYFVSAEDFCGKSLGQGVSAKVKITVAP